MQLHAPIQPCLWFDTQAEEAARYYTGIFPDSRIVRTAYYGQAGHDIHHMPAGTVLTVEFELAGRRFTAMNGGPGFPFTHAVSFQVLCDDQAQIDRYWELLGEGGDAAARECGWLKDRFGLSWQVVPARIGELVSGPNGDAVMAALLKMKKLDLATLQAAGGAGDLAI
ncbi:VOC family protein [Massilia sp.]|uniref:VOC family protein n=1 Tax=Massilia sp. TaxID=1882437 RepID=UPI0028982A03|nr:VOC family protein [Massilia sp.]